MSKGLGELKRRILDCLDNPPAQTQAEYGPRMEVEKGVYDLRIVARFVAGGEAAVYFGSPFYPTASFSAAFSRAVRSLIRRGELEEVRHANRWGGSLSRQTRFVRRAALQ
jgi:hypothetical protein